MEEMDKSVLLFLHIDCGQATATTDACSGCPRREVFSGEKEICHCFLSQLHSSLIEHKHLLWSLPIPEPIWDVGARNIPSSWEIALASIGCTFTSHRLRPPDPLCLRRPSPPSSLLLPRPRPIIRSSSGEIGNLTRGQRCKCMRFLERARRYFWAASSKSEDGRLGERDRERVVWSGGMRCFLCRNAAGGGPHCRPPEMDEVIGGGGGGTAPNTEWRLARAKSILHFSSFLEWPSSGGNLPSSHDRPRHLLLRSQSMKTASKLTFFGIFARVGHVHNSWGEKPIARQVRSAHPRSLST